MTEWLLLAGALLVLGGFLAYVVSQERRGIDDRERAHLESQARVIEQNLVRQLHSINRALVGIRNYFLIWRTEKEGIRDAGRRLRAMADAMPGVRTMLIFDAEGNAIASNRDGLQGRNFAHRDYFQAVLKNRPRRRRCHARG